jgi:1-acyl-sn-glycerol-3-phosphate acyltransferase
VTVYVELSAQQVEAARLEVQAYRTAGLEPDPFVVRVAEAARISGRAVRASVSLAEPQARDDHVQNSGGSDWTSTSMHPSSSPGMSAATRPRRADRSWPTRMLRRALAALTQARVSMPSGVLYWLIKFVALGPVLRVIFRSQVEGLENVPRTGSAILASNHLSAADWILMPLRVKRQVNFLAKAEYFAETGLKGFLQRLIFSGSGQVPISASGRSAADDAIRTGIEVLRKGNLLGIYPEGARSPDGRLYRAKTGVARLALEVGCPVVPVAMIYARHKSRRGREILRVKVRFGRPLDFSHYAGMSGDASAERKIADEIMLQIAALSGQDYADVDAGTARRQMEATLSDSHKGAEGSIRQDRPGEGAVYESELTQGLVVDFESFRMKRMGYSVESGAESPPAANTS